MPSIKKTLQIREFIEVYQQIHRQSPTYQTIADHFGFRSLASVHRHIEIMEKRGWVKHSRYQRWIEIVKTAQQKAA